MEKVVLKNNELYREYLDRIKIAIMKKAIYEKRAQDGNNRTILGNSSFWFQKGAEDDNYYLIFDRDTALWDLDRIKIDLENLELALAKQTIY